MHNQGTYHHGPDRTANPIACREPDEWPTPSLRLAALTAGDAVVAHADGVPRIEGTVEEVDATLGVVWVRDGIGERRLLLDGDFVLHRRAAGIHA